MMFLCQFDATFFNDSNPPHNCSLTDCQASSPPWTRHSIRLQPFTQYQTYLKHRTADCRCYI